MKKAADYRVDLTSRTDAVSAKLLGVDKVDKRDVPALPRIWLIAPAFPPENVIGGQRPARFAKYLPQWGYNVRVITGTQTQENASLTSVPYRRSARDRVLELSVMCGDDRFGWAGQVVRVASNLHDSDRPVAVISTSPPASAHIAALRLKERFSLPWVADFRDPLVGNLGRTSLLVRCVDRLTEHLIARKADAVVLNTRLRAAVWAQRYPQWAAKFCTIYNGFDEAMRLRPLPFQVPTPQVWLHIGSLYSGRYLKRFLDALDVVRRQGQLKETLRLSLIGEFHPSAALAFETASFSCLAEHGWANYRAERIPQPEAHRLTASAHKLVLLDHVNTQGNREVPAKLYDYVQVGRPVITCTTRSSEVTSLLHMSGIPHVCLYDDEPEESWVQQIVAFAALPSEASPLDPRFAQQFNAQVQTGQLASLLDGIVSSDMSSHRASSASVV